MQEVTTFSDELLKDQKSTHSHSVATLKEQRPNQKFCLLNKRPPAEYDSATSLECYPPHIFRLQPRQDSLHFLSPSHGFVLLHPLVWLAPPLPLGSKALHFRPGHLREDAHLQRDHSGIGWCLTANWAVDVERSSSASQRRHGPAGCALRRKADALTFRMCRKRTALPYSPSWCPCPRSLSDALAP